MPDAVNASGRPKLAAYASPSCRGCLPGLLALDDGGLAQLADIVFWPELVDFRFEDLERLADGAIDIALFSGVLADAFDTELARLLRAKARKLVAVGACSCFGGVPGLVRMSPAASATVSTLDQVVPVDYHLPGCPAPRAGILGLVEALAGGAQPAALARRALCSDCERTRSGKRVARFCRRHQVVPNSQRCFLEQGLVCLGPATRGGCGQRCLSVDMPCRGCFGPPEGVADQGAAMLGAIASIHEAAGEAAVLAMLEEIVDPAGTFYRYTLATSILRGTGGNGT